MTANNIFENLDSLRLAPETAGFSGTRELLTHVPVRRPKPEEWFRIHPDESMSLATIIFEAKEEGQTFFDDAAPKRDLQQVGH